MILNKHRFGGRVYAMRKDDEKPLILPAIWSLIGIGVIISKATGNLDAPWLVVTLPFWGPILIGLVFYVIAGE